MYSFPRPVLSSKCIHVMGGILPAVQDLRTTGNFEVATNALAISGKCNAKVQLPLFRLFVVNQNRGCNTSPTLCCSVVAAAGCCDQPSTHRSGRGMMELPFGEIVHFRLMSLVRWGACVGYISDNSTLLALVRAFIV